MLYYVRSFYFFKPLQISRLSPLKIRLTEKAKQHQVLGLVILGTEGLNTTLASKNKNKIDSFVMDIENLFNENDFKIKKSVSTKAPFRRFTVKIKTEIVTMKKPDLVPKGEHCHLSPERWHHLLKEDVVLVDVRNDYEQAIGSFEGAVHLNIKEFSEFPQKIRQLQSNKEKPHLIFCTGGIRCEKAIYEMDESGYKNIYQLDGGILNYMEKYPEGRFKGECFVFDSRVAVDKNLEDSKYYSLCPHCGEVGNLKIKCLKCDGLSKLCKSCKDKTKKNPEYETCSKNCRHHYLRNPHKKSPQQKQFYHSKQGGQKSKESLKNIR